MGLALATLRVEAVDNRKEVLGNTAVDFDGRTSRDVGGVPRFWEETLWREKL